MNKYYYYNNKINKLIDKTELYLINTNKKNYNYYKLIHIFKKINYYKNKLLKYNMN